MDFEQNDNRMEPLHPQPPLGQMASPPKKRRGWKIFWGIVTALSVLTNFILFIMVIGLVATFATSHDSSLTEEVILAGPRTAKIAVITIQGVIEGQKAHDVHQQLKTASQDKHVKGLIIRVNSPGGTISASDQIYNEIRKYRAKQAKPVVAFMQGVAASGGYYVSVATEQIIAEPTVITGSIGVIMGHFVLQELFEEKLGIKPVIIKSGEKKDWPSPFSEVTDRQRQYLQDKVIAPAYERFVQVIADGRADLSVADVKRLGDGSIYGAAEALDVKLIDDIGYLDEAIATVMSMAGIEEAQVVEYRKPFSLSSVFGASSMNFLKIDRATLYELATPQLLYLWSVY